MLEKDGGGETGADLLGGDRDLAGLLVGLLADEPHHLLDLLGDIGVVHLGDGCCGGSGPPAKLLAPATTAREKRTGRGWSEGGRGRAGSPREWSRWRTSWGKSNRGSNVIGLAPLLAAACLYVPGIHNFVDPVHGSLIYTFALSRCLTAD